MAEAAAAEAAAKDAEGEARDLAAWLEEAYAREEEHPLSYAVNSSSQREAGNAQGRAKELRAAADALADELRARTEASMDAMTDALEREHQKAMNDPDYD
ncbi:MAG: hypothetical protein LBJ11_01005 [Oscillospiraceae bacterium]|nr:hypothetical protein [Oscillospiraceae bacterium]